jgi:predicted nucleic acid-binding protein
VIVVDSSVWIAKMRGASTAAAQKLDRIADEFVDEICVGDLVLLEVLQGARDEAHAGFIEARLRAFHVEPMLNPRLAAIGARNFRQLRGFGVTIRKTIDIIIATFCIEGGHRLLHDDHDFDAIARRLPLRVF